METYNEWSFVDGDSEVDIRRDPRGLEDYGLMIKSNGNYLDLPRRTMPDIANSPVEESNTIIQKGRRDFFIPVIHCWLCYLAYSWADTHSWVHHPDICAAFWCWCAPSRRLTSNEGDESEEINITECISLSLMTKRHSVICWLGF